MLTLRLIMKGRILFFFPGPETFVFQKMPCNPALVNFMAFSEIPWRSSVLLAVHILTSLHHAENRTKVPLLGLTTSISMAAITFNGSNGACFFSGLFCSISLLVMSNALLKATSEEMAAPGPIPAALSKNASVVPKDCGTVGGASVSLSSTR